MIKVTHIDLIKDYKNKQSNRKTSTHKLRELKESIKRATKYSNTAYINAIERNKKRSKYNHMILKLQSTLHPSEKEKIVNEYIRDKDKPI